jgi:hypothetical protein
MKWELLKARFSIYVNWNAGIDKKRMSQCGKCQPGRMV